MVTIPIQEFIWFWVIAEIVSVLINLPQILAGKSPFKPGHLYLAPMAAAAAVGGVVGAAQLGVGIAQKIKANKIARSNKRPVLEENEFLDDSYNLAESRAGQGLTDGARDAYTTAADRAMASSINALLKSGGNANNIADLYQGSQSGIRAIALADEEARVRNNEGYLRVAQQKADEERDRWFVNQFSPYQDLAAASTQLSADGMKNIFSGLGTVAGAGMQMLGSKAPALPTTAQSAGNDTGFGSFRPAFRQQSSVPVSGAVNTGAMQLPDAPSMNFGAPSLYQGFNTNRPNVPARWNQELGRWE